VKTLQVQFSVKKEDNRLARRPPCGSCSASTITFRACAHASNVGAMHDAALCRRRSASIIHAWMGRELFVAKTIAEASPIAPTRSSDLARARVDSRWCAATQRPFEFAPLHQAAIAV